MFSDDELRNIKIPDLLVYGDKEAIYNYDLAIQRAKSLMENLSVKIVEKGNHITAATNYEQINQMIPEFLKSVECTAHIRW